MLQWFVRGVVVVGIVGEGGVALFCFDLAGFHVESRGLGRCRRTRACSLLFRGTLLPLEDTRPVIQFFFVEFLFPFSFGFLTILAIVSTLVAAGAVASLNVVEKLLLELGSDFLSVDRGFQVGSFEPFGEFGGLFVFRAAGEMRFIAGVGARGVARFGLILLLVPFFFCALLLCSFVFWSVKEIRDGGFHTSKIRWVGARVDCAFDFVERVF